jgi:cysteinyl-tRNA synthetase
MGESIDIHGGGRDLIFPHHENERAQSCCAYGGDFVRYWLHNAYVDMDGVKMSKSLGNVRSVRELLEHYPGEVLRFALLSAHYRSPLNFSSDLLDGARASLDTLYNALRQSKDVKPEEIDVRETEVFESLKDDLNTPKAIAALHAAAKALNKADSKLAAKAKGELVAGARILGLLSQDPEKWFTAICSDTGDIDADAVDALIAERIAAKGDKDYARADAIREQLSGMGILLEDGADGTSWRRG